MEQFGSIYRTDCGSEEKDSHTEWMLVFSEFAHRQWMPGLVPNTHIFTSWEMEVGPGKTETWEKDEQVRNNIKQILQE